MCSEDWRISYVNAYAMAKYRSLKPTACSRNMFDDCRAEMHADESASRNIVRRYVDRIESETALHRRWPSMSNEERLAELNARLGIAEDVEHRP